MFAMKAIETNGNTNCQLLASWPPPPFSTQVFGYMDIL